MVTVTPTARMLITREVLKTFRPTTAGSHLVAAPSRPFHERIAMLDSPLEGISLLEEP